MAFERGAGLAHGRFRAREPGLRGSQIGLLLGRVETSQHVVRRDMLADVGGALDHPPADAERQIRSD